MLLRGVREHEEQVDWPEPVGPHLGLPKLVDWLTGSDMCDSECGNSYVIQGFCHVLSLLKQPSTPCEPWGGTEFLLHCQQAGRLVLLCAFQCPPQT